MAAALNPIEMLGIQASTAMRWTFGTIGWTLTVFLVFFNALGVGAYLRAYKGPEYLRIYKEYKDLGVKLRKAGFDPAKDRVMLHNTWDLYDADPLSVVRTPDEPLPRILDTAQKLGVTWILVEDEPDDGTKLALGRPYRAQIYHVYRDKELFWVVFRNETLRLSAVKIRGK
jgi:hypothetical protein